MRNQQATKLPAQPTTQPDTVQPVTFDYLKTELPRVGPAMVDYHQRTGKIADWWFGPQFKLVYTSLDGDNCLIAFTWCRQTNRNERKLLREVFDVAISTEEEFAYSNGWGATTYTWSTTPPDTPARPVEQLNMFLPNKSNHNYQEA